MCLNTCCWLISVSESQKNHKNSFLQRRPDNCLFSLYSFQYVCLRPIFYTSVECICMIFKPLALLVSQFIKLWRLLGVVSFGNSNLKLYNNKLLAEHAMAVQIKRKVVALKSHVSLCLSKEPRFFFFFFDLIWMNSRFCVAGGKRLLGRCVQWWFHLHFQFSRGLVCDQWAF